MKIRDKKSGDFCTVYGIYWFEEKCYFCCFSSKGVGLSSYSQSEVEVIDRLLGADFEFKKIKNGMCGVFHHLLLKDNIMEDLFEHDPQAYNKFIELLGNKP